MEVRKFIIAPDVSIREAIRQLDQTARKKSLLLKKIISWPVFSQTGISGGGY